MRYFLLALLISLQPQVFPSGMAKAGIYQSENHWSWEYEEEFAHWLEEAASDPDFFKKHGIAIDCADTTYGFRWIFARIHKLPMLTTTVSDGVVSHETNHPEWSGLATANEWFNDQRFLTALNYILHKSWTETLAEDSYPVNLGMLIPGTFFLNLGPSKHVDLIYKVNGTDPEKMPFEFVSSSVPREVKSTKYLVYWYEEKPASEAEGFRRFLWPVKTAKGWEYVPPEEMPYYSHEQFLLSLQGQSFHNYVYEMAKPHMDKKALARTSLLELKKYVHERVEVVNKGYKTCIKSRFNRHRCRQKSSKLFDAWSTPSRDKRIAMHIEATKAELERANLGFGWQSHFLSMEVFAMNNKVLTLFDISEIWRMKSYRSEPSVRPDKRWGQRLRGSKLVFRLL